MSHTTHTHVVCLRRTSGCAFGKRNVWAMPSKKPATDEPLAGGAQLDGLTPAPPPGATWGLRTSDRPTGDMTGCLGTSDRKAQDIVDAQSSMKRWSVLFDALRALRKCPRPRTARGHRAARARARTVRARNRPQPLTRACRAHASNGDAYDCEKHSENKDDRRKQGQAPASAIAGKMGKTSH